MSTQADSEAAPAMLHLVIRLRRAGLPVSVGDYLKGLRALELIHAPFEYLAPVARNPARTTAEMDRHRKAARERLVWLVQTLWARSAEERDLVRKVVETEIPLAPPAFAAALAAALAGVDPRTVPSPEPQPRPPPQDEAKAEATEEKRDAAEGKGGEAAGTEVGKSEEARSAELVADDRLPLPEIIDAELPRSHLFELADTQIVSPLWLTTLWRRFQEPHHVEDRSRIDVALTVSRTVRSGGLPLFVHARRRKNKARLMVFIDAGPAMAPWAGHCREIVETLAPDNSRLESVTVRYFSGAPGRQVFRDADLARPRLLAEELRENEGVPALVIGEAGAARPPRGDLDARLSSFLAETVARDVRPLVWINPMPAARWQPAFRARIAGAPHARALVLGQEALLQAVDILRGQP